MNKIHRLFAYGTLKRGFYFYPKYLEGKSEFLGPVVADTAYTMYIDGLPHLVKEPTDAAVKGELFLVDQPTLEAIDALEGHPLVYKRELIDVYNEAGERILAWAYLRHISFKGTGAFKETEFV